jgi:aspartate aminotransferase
MNSSPYSQRIQAMMDASQATIDFVSDPIWEERRKDPQACDFLLGNPQEFPLQGIPTALQKWSVPQNKEWFAYKMSEEHSQQVVAESLRASHHLPFVPESIVMTTGAFAGLAVTLGLIIDPGDEVIYISPPWFFYETLILSHHGIPVRVPCDAATYDLDLGAIRRAITPRTRGIIINSPNNPTGRIYPPATLQALADLLAEASRVNGRTLYLISDEAYNRIVFDGKPFHSPAAFYPNTFLIYTYGKTLLAPGQRIGYVALPPAMPNQAELRDGLIMSMVANGFTFPNALLQHALEDLQRLSIDVAHIQEKRDRLAHALLDMGYSLQIPEGTFYLLVRSPLPDDRAFVDRLAEHKIYCLPGTIYELPGTFRISLTANDEMIERSLPGFRQALEAARPAAQQEGVDLGSAVRPATAGR